MSMASAANPQSQFVAPIFLKDDGTPLRVFAQATDIHGRPKLAKDLKKRAGQICTDPKSADVIVINQNSSEGQRFLERWGQDSGKIVLHYTWIQACIAANRLLGPRDNFGGLAAQIRAIDDEDDDGQGDPPGDSVQADAALPTPRPSPENLQQAAGTALASHPSSVGQAASNLPSTSQLPPPANNTVAFQQNAPPLQFANIPTMPQAPGYHNPIVQTMSPNGQPYHPNVLLAIADVLGQSDDPTYKQWALTVQAMGPTLLPEPVAQRTPTPAVEFPLAAHRPEVPRIETANVDFKMFSPAPPSASSQTSQMEGKKREKHKSKTLKLKSGPLFSREGKALSFYVQVEHVRRNALASAIKNNGGKMETSVDQAQYAIFDSPGSPTSKKYREFMHFIRTAELANVPVVSGRFIEDCVEKGRLVDFTRYIVDVPAQPKHRRESAPNSPSARESISPPIHRKTPEPQKKAKIRIADFAELEERADRRSGPRGPINRYTPDEINRALEIALKIFTHDPDAPEAAVSRAVFSQIPTHTERAWNTHLVTKYREELSEARRKGGVLFRKARRHAEEQEAAARRKQSGQSSTPSQTPNFGHARTPSIPPTPVPPQPLNPFAADLEDISMFFAKGEDSEYGDGDDRNLNREAIFKKLTRKIRCRTKKTWDDFQRAYPTEIQNRVNEIVSTLPA